MPAIRTHGVLLHGNRQLTVETKPGTHALPWRTPPTTD